MKWNIVICNIFYNIHKIWPKLTLYPKSLRRKNSHSFFQIIPFFKNQDIKIRALFRMKSVLFGIGSCQKYKIAFNRKIFVFCSYNESTSKKAEWLLQINVKTCSDINRRRTVTCAITYTNFIKYSCFSYRIPICFLLTVYLIFLTFTK